MNKLIILPLAVTLTLTSCEKKETIINQQPSTDTMDGTLSVQDSLALVDSSLVAPTTTNSSVEIPLAVTAFVTKYYPKTSIAKTEIKSSPFEGKSYEVKLVDGTEIDINENGSWEEVKDVKGVPTDLIPNEIKSYLNTNYKGIIVEKIEKERKGYTVELIDNTDLEFDSNGKFLRIDK